MGPIRVGGKWDQSGEVVGGTNQTIVTEITGTKGEENTGG